MATKTVTIDTGEWIYIDNTGIPHVVTNAQTFQFTLTDGGAAAVTYNVIAGETVTTTDGYVLTFDSESIVRTVDIGTFADTEDAVNVHNKRGELRITCSSTGIPQIWRWAQSTFDNVDAPTAITNWRLEDQFGNVMVLPSTGSGITVA